MEKVKHKRQMPNDLTDMWTWERIKWALRRLEKEWKDCKVVD